MDIPRLSIETRGNPGNPDAPSAEDEQDLREAVRRLRQRVRELQNENTALRYAAQSFGELADRLNVALHAERARRRNGA